MKTYGVSRSTTALAQRAWNVWGDPNNWSRWNSGIKAAQLDGPLANDVRFSNVVEGRGFTMTMGGPPA